MAASEIQNTVTTLFNPGDVIEVRLRKEGKWYSGYYDYAHFDKLAEDVAKYDDLNKTEAVYYTANPAQDVLLARCNNHIERADITTSDDHIKYRKYLPIDIDPERPTKTSSTDAQHALSIKLAYDVATKMTVKHGWPAPIIGDSGNGAHLLYQIDEPNTPEAKNLIDAVLTAIIEDNKNKDGIKIEKWANAGRIWKLYGTMNRKGDELPDMKIYHRRSKLLQVPENMQVVTTEQLQAMAKNPAATEVTPPVKSIQKPKKTKNIFDIVAWMDKYNIEVERTKTEPGLTLYVLKTCPINPDHTGNRESVIMQEDGGKLAFKCHHNSCADIHWSDVREKYEPGYKEQKQKTDNHFLYFDEKNRFVPKILADELLHEKDIITYQDTKEIALYVSGVFVVEGGEDALRLSGLNKLGQDFKRDRINEVIEYIKLNTLVKRQNINQDPNLINLRNGMYVVDTNELIPHGAKYLSTIQLNVMYDENAQCGEVDSFLNDVAEPNDIPVLVQYVGYSCTEDIKQQRALMIEGPRSNGKSTFLDLVCNMIGQENVAEQSIQALNTDRFSRAQLNGKLVNIFPDLSKKKIYDNTVFKMLTTDEYIDGEEKYVRKFRFKNKCHQMYSANVVPDVDDPDELAYFRRWILATFPNIFEGKKADKHLIDKLTTEYEIAGFFNICMIGLRALLKHDDFCDKSSVKDIQKRYLIKSNPIRAFLDECIEYSEHDLVKRDLFDVYEAWCKNRNITTTIKDNVFGRKIKKIGYEDGREANEQRKTVWKNIGISFNGLYCQGSVKDAEITLTDLNESTDTDNTPVRQGSRDTYPIVEKYKKIYNTIYSEEVVYDLNPGTLTDSKKHHGETSDKYKGLINNPDGTLTNPDGLQKDQRTRMKDVKDIILSIQSGNGNRANRDEIKTAAEDIGIDDTDDILKNMASQGQVLQHEDDVFQVV